MKLDVDAVMQRVREEVVRRQETRAGAVSSNAIALSSLPAWSSAVPALPMKTEYVLGDLLAHSDRAFIESAYNAILRRPSDPEGMATYLGNLRSGAMSKVEVIAALRWSPEGEAKGVHVDGLLAPYLLQKWRRKPIVGPLLGWLQAFVRLPVLIDRTTRLDAVQARETQQLGRFVNELGAQVDVRLRQLEILVEREQRQRIEELERRLDEVAVRDSHSAAAADAIHARLADIGSELEDRRDSLRLSIVLQDERVAALAAEFSTQLGATNDRLQIAIIQQDERFAALVAEFSTQLGATNDRLQIAIAQHAGSIAAHDETLERQIHQLAAHSALLADIEHSRQAHEISERALDSLYVAFEERFRGARELIRARVLPYIAILHDAQVGTPATPVLDIGCGRGDWLDVMREHHLVSRGVDSNHVFVELCRGRGLDVIEADVVQMLRGLPDGSLGGVTGLHIAEHLPFEILVELLDECRRVLCIGGVLVLETPNPENLQVAAHYFYMDPTHRNPLPPEALRWIVEARGFERVRIERLTEARELDVPPLLDEDLPGAGSVNFVLRQLHAAPDYAIVARRL